MELDLPGTASPFDGLRRVAADGSEYWSARELMPLLGYNTWAKFEQSLDRAKAAAQVQGHDVSRLFAPKGENTSGRPRANFHLARFAAYLVAMNGDPRKPEVAAAQAYFAIKTREAEVVQAQIPQTYAAALRAAASEAERADLAEAAAAEAALFVGAATSPGVARRLTIC